MHPDEKKAHAESGKERAYGEETEKLRFMPISADFYVVTQDPGDYEPCNSGIYITDGNMLRHAATNVQGHFRSGGPYTVPSGQVPARLLFLGAVPSTAQPLDNKRLYREIRLDSVINGDLAHQAFLAFDEPGMPDTTVKLTPVMGPGGVSLLLIESAV